MIAAIGDIKTDEFVDAAISLSNGVGACHELSDTCPENKGSGVRHYDGWGAVYLKQGHLECVRGAMPIGKDPTVASMRGISTSALVIHVRNASIKSKKGIDFVHPVKRELDSGPGYFFHNGFVPEAYSLINRDSSRWDTEDLCDWLLPALRMNDNKAVKSRLAQLPPSTSSANFIFLRRGCVVICNWFPEPHRQPKYYTMWQLQTERMQIYSSEPLPQFAPVDRWRQVQNQTITTLDCQQMGDTPTASALRVENVRQAGC